MTAMLEHETLTDMDDETRRGLAEAADNVLNGPDRLKARIVVAARAGEKPADIHKVIHPAYTYDYVASLVRKDRVAHPEEYRRAPLDTPEPPVATPDDTVRRTLENMATEVRGQGSGAPKFMQEPPGDGSPDGN